MKIGDKIIWKPFNYAEHKPDTSHPWYGAKGVIVKSDYLGTWWITLDNFPPCNYREHANKFLAAEKELEVIKVWQRLI